MVERGADGDLTRVAGQRQHAVSTVRDPRGMPEDQMEAMIRRAIGGDSEAIDAVLLGATESNDARIVAMAGVLASRPDWIERAERLAVTNRDRQMVAVSACHVSGDHGLAQLLARDHLSDHPDSLIVAWIASLGPQI